MKIMPWSSEPNLPNWRCHTCICWLVWMWHINTWRPPKLIANCYHVPDSQDSIKQFSKCYISKVYKILVSNLSEYGSVYLINSEKLGHSRIWKFPAQIKFIFSGLWIYIEGTSFFIIQMTQAWYAKQWS